MVSRMKRVNGSTTKMNTLFKKTGIYPITIYSMITPFDAFEIYVFGNTMENRAFAAPFSILNLFKSIQNFPEKFFFFFSMSKNRK